MWNKEKLNYDKNKVTIAILDQNLDMNCKIQV